jgi:hypothetical protein
MLTKSVSGALAVVSSRGFVLSKRGAVDGIDRILLYCLIRGLFEVTMISLEEIAWNDSHFEAMSLYLSGSTEDNREKLRQT